MLSAKLQSPARLRFIGILVASTVVALAAAWLAYSTIKPIAAAEMHVFVDSPSPSVVQQPAYPVGALIQRAELFGRVVTSPPAVAHIAQLTKIPKNELGAYARTTALVPAAFREPASEERAAEILMQDRPYRLEVEARTTTPVLDIYTHAPTLGEAKGLADAAYSDLQQRLGKMADDEGIAVKDRVVLRRLGPPRGGPINNGMAAAVGAFTYLIAFALVFLVLRRLFRDPAEAARPRPRYADTDAWPHTGRLAPWMFAMFLVVVWLVPFDDIHLKVQMPIDLGFDRLVLPVVIATWIMAILGGGAASPRLRITPIHIAVGIFVLCAFLSVILNAGSLNESLELEGALKQLPLLLSYVSLFVIAATAVRANEVNTFLSFTLALAVICAVGTLWEYRFKQNLFYIWSDKLLPPIFDVGHADSAAVDDIGRRVVRGPAIVPLETVAMLGMALGIPIVRLTQTQDWRRRLMYGLAAALLFAAAFATFRKSALLAPISVVAAIAYFRRRELLKLSPLALMIVIMLPILAPGAVGMTTTQFEPSRLGVSTVSDRSSDYDAVRPDVWSHLLLGKGWGSYDPVSYRILDSELLHRLVEMGVLGLLAYVGMMVAVVWTARRTINDRDPRWAPLALIGTAAAVSFLVVSALFDVLAFPHDVYIFLYMAGLVSVVVSRDRDGAERHEHDGERVRRIPFKRVERREHASVGAHETPARRAGGGRPTRRREHERALHGGGQGGSRQAVLDGGPPPKGGDRDHGSVPPPRPAGAADPPRRPGGEDRNAPKFKRRRRTAGAAVAFVLALGVTLGMHSRGGSTPQPAASSPAVAAETATPQPFPKLTGTPPKQLRKPHRRKPRKHRAPVRTTTPPGEIMAITAPTSTPVPTPTATPRYVPTPAPTPRYVPPARTPTPRATPAPGGSFDTGAAKPKPTPASGEFDSSGS
jgi:O-antigen ligase